MSETVKVIVRCRPLSEKEREMKTRLVIETKSAVHQCILKKPGDEPKISKTFTFDGVYGISSSTEKIYSEIVSPIVNGVIEGYNGTVFAYGQTSCGKTFTMEGVQTPSAQKGIIPRCCEHILNSAYQHSLEKQAKFLLRVSYLEIYKEEIRDLLVKECRYKPEIKEHPDKGIYVNGLSTITVNSYEEMQEILETGGKNRSVGATLLNADSSRSHSIFTIDLEACLRASPDEKEVYRTGKLNLVDLAGSERQSKSGCSGERFKESTKINLSLSVLGNVISALVDGKSKHVPYRDSKLTRLLQDSLGGNSKTLMVACISPGENNYEETLSTLRYTKRAKSIKNKPKINEDPKDTIIKRYHDEIQHLKKIIAQQIPVPSQLLTELQEVRDEHTSRSVGYVQMVTHTSENLETDRTRQSSEISIDEYQTRLSETQNLHIKACQETSTLKRELDELKTRLQIQQRKLDYEARKSILEEHKTALMLLRGRRIADGGCASHAGSNTQCRSTELTEVASSIDSSPEVTSSTMLRLSDHTHTGIERKSYSEFKRVRTAVTSGTEKSPPLEIIPEPAAPLMVSVATSTDDLYDLDTDVELPKANEPEVEENDWTIRENMLCREEAEGCSRSASPFNVEKRSHTSKQGPSSKYVYPMDEEGPVNLGLCCLCPKRSFFGERLEEFLRHKQKLS